MAANRQDSSAIPEVLQGANIPVILILAALVVGIVLGGISSDYWSAAKASRDGAAAGSDLLADTGLVHAVKAWLTPMEFLGMAFLFSAITLALATIVTALRFQARRLVEIAEEKLS